MALFDALADGARRSGTLRCWTGDAFAEAPWTDVVRDAERMTAGLRRAGVEPGTRVAAMLTNTPYVVRGLLGTWLAGGAVASLPMPVRGSDPREYAKLLASACERLEAVVLLADEQLLAALPPELAERTPVLSWESLADSGRVEPSPPGDDDVAFIQYSSGSTSAPKGCMLSPRAIEAQIELLIDLLEPRPEGDTGVSWLPLSHDMGMFGGLLTPWYHGASLVLSTPQRFMFGPSTWLTDAAQFGATVTMGPDAALHLAARALRPQRMPRDLELRVCIIGAERVHAETLALVTERLEPYGFRPEVLMPAYGLAEATLAVTATPLREAPRHLVLDSIALADGTVQEVPDDHPSATRMVSAGPPGLGAEVHGMSADTVGEIRVRARSLASGYFREPELTAERFRDGELLTGDLGFVRDGHLYPVGRLDDLVMVAGRSVYTREIEAEVASLDAVRHGCAAIVESDDGGRLVLLAELTRPLDDYRDLADEAAGIAMSKAGVALDTCMWLRKGSLPKTPSGKIQRHRCRYMLGSGAFEPFATVDLAQVVS